MPLAKTRIQSYRDRGSLKSVVEYASLIASSLLLLQDSGAQFGGGRGGKSRWKFFQVNDTSWNLLERDRDKSAAADAIGPSAHTSYNSPSGYSRQRECVHPHTRVRTARLFNSTEWKAPLSRRYACKTGGRRFVSHTSAQTHAHTRARRRALIR